LKCPGLRPKSVEEIDGEEDTLKRLEVFGEDIFESR
jgi:hypothetical protein